jgi:nucleoid-associated protein YgaU
MKRTMFSSVRVLATALFVFAAGTTFTACMSTGDGTDSASAVEGEAAASENTASNENLAGENASGENAAKPEGTANAAAANASADPFAGALNNNVSQPPAAGGAAAQPANGGGGELETLVTESASGAAPNGPVAGAANAPEEADPFAPVVSKESEAKNAVASANTAVPAPTGEKVAEFTDNAAPPGVGALPEVGSSMPYYIKKGDTLSKIAAEVYGDKSMWRSLAEDNSIQDPSLIYAGDIVFYKLTEKSKGFAGAYESVQKKMVTVEKGDTLSGIALKVLGSSGEWRTLWKMNAAIANPDVLHVGMVLTFRAPTASASLETEGAEVAVNE